MQLEQYYSDDYAGLTSGNLHFYYGYEVEDPKTQDWCFQVKKDGVEIFRATSKEIEKAVKNERLSIVQDYFLAGIGIWLLLK